MSDRLLTQEPHRWKELDRVGDFLVLCGHKHDNWAFKNIFFCQYPIRAKWFFSFRKGETIKAEENIKPAKSLSE